MVSKKSRFFPNFNQKKDMTRFHFRESLYKYWDLSVKNSKHSRPFHRSNFRIRDPLRKETWEKSIRRRTKRNGTKVFIFHFQPCVSRFSLWKKPYQPSLTVMAPPLVSSSKTFLHAMHVYYSRKEHGLWKTDPFELFPSLPWQCFPVNSNRERKYHIRVPSSYLSLFSDRHWLSIILFILVYSCTWDEKDASLVIFSSRLNTILINTKIFIGKYHVNE